MNPNSQVMDAIESLEQQFSDLLRQIDTATGLSASQQTESLEEFGNRQLLNRLDQLVLAGTSASPANATDREVREEIRNLSELLEKKFSHVAETSNQSELLVRSWQEQLDRMEQRLESLMETLPAAARFG